MINLKLGLKISLQNFRKWRNDYKVLIVFVFLIIVNHYCASWFIDFSNNLSNKAEIAPWIYVFAFTTSWGFEKIMMMLPLLLLFSNAPFIDENQPYIIARCTRKSWCIGQLIYIAVSSFIYVILSYMLSVIMLIGRLDFTNGWGSLISTAAKEKTIDGAMAVDVSKDVIYYFSPQTALFYTLLLQFLACLLIGLLIYVINSLSNNIGYGVFVGAALIIFDYVQCLIRGASGTHKFDWLIKISPVSWCSINNIHILENDNLPSIEYVIVGYLLLIFILCIIALRLSKKQEIKVISDIQ